MAPAVFADLSILVERFEVGPGHGLAEFKEAWQQMEFGRIFSTQKLAGRVPGTDETHEEYIVLLLRAATAHLCPKRYPQFEHRLGGIFLVWMLHATQPLEPKVPVRVDAVDWANLEALARECEQRQQDAREDLRERARCDEGETRGEEQLALDARREREISRPEDLGLRRPSGQPRPPPR